MTREELVENGEGIANNGNLTVCLANLETSGFVRKYAIPGHRTRGVVYQLIDNYTLFYFKFVRSNLGKDEHFWSADEARKLRNRVESYRREMDYRGNIHLTMVASGGIKANRQSGVLQSTVTLDDLFADA